jgi:hypothetical protein
VNPTPVNVTPTTPVNVTPTTPVTVNAPVTTILLVEIQRAAVEAALDLEHGVKHLGERAMRALAKLNIVNASTLAKAIDEDTPKLIADLDAIGFKADNKLIQGWRKDIHLPPQVP